MSVMDGSPGSVPMRTPAREYGPHDELRVGSRRNRGIGGVISMKVILAPTQWGRGLRRLVEAKPKPSRSWERGLPDKGSHLSQLRVSLRFAPTNPAQPSPRYAGGEESKGKIIARAGRPELRSAPFDRNRAPLHFDAHDR